MVLISGRLSRKISLLVRTLLNDSIGICGTRVETVKLLSINFSKYDDAAVEGIRRLLEIFTGKEIRRKQRLDTSLIKSIRMGTTVATNALLERKGEKSALLITKGFKDLLLIGNQSRPRIFDLTITKPGVLYEDVVEVDERVTLCEWTENTRASPGHLDDEGAVYGISGERVQILKKIDTQQVETDLKLLHDKGYRSLAVVFAHSYTYPIHEQIVGSIAEKLGFENVSLSSSLTPMIKMVPRGMSATADAYLTPEVRRYVDNFARHFDGKLGSEAVQQMADCNDREAIRCDFMQSDGGLVDIYKFSGIRAVLSGPAGGVIGYARTSYDTKEQISVIGFDMGGTSTDVSRFDGQLEHVFSTTTAGVTVQTPQLDIHTVAAGGGTRLYWKNGLFVVGPESAGAYPGPACYKNGGPLTVSDANLLLGRLPPDTFPNIFGPNENEPINMSITKELFEQLAVQINDDLKGDRHLTCDEVAYGFIKVANETMAKPIRALTESKGHELASHRLAVFGGAGGQHACAIASTLEITQILIHKYSSLLSAYGMILADVVHEISEPSFYKYELSQFEFLRHKLETLKNSAKEELFKQGFTEEFVEVELYLNMRYQGTDTAVMVLKPRQSWDFESQFVKTHEQEYGFVLPDRDILVDDIRVRGIGISYTERMETVDEQLNRLQFIRLDQSNSHSKSAVYFENIGRVEILVYMLKDLKSGDEIKGPALVIDETQTILIEPNAVAKILDTHVFIHLDFSKNLRNHKEVADSRILDPILLSIFGHRFMAIAEQMGKVLQKTSVSTNVKERLDFSCAVFDSSGGLVANAPHIPVHLGSMSTVIAKQAEIWNGQLYEGDVLVSNHPDFGGTHLPDITVITPAFNEDKIIFYVASRAHHADIGGTLPGSMPPNSKTLYEEGAAIKSEKLVSQGRFNEERITELLVSEPSKYPGSSGTRALKDNLNDLKAQIAANQRGIQLIAKLVKHYGIDVVQRYMYGIQEVAEQTVRNLLGEMKNRIGNTLEAVDKMDDGSTICLQITIKENDNAGHYAEFDFAGTSPEVYGNTNAPESISYSAIMYCLRCLFKDEIPLNQGCLRPICVIIPKGSLLSPSEGAAVVGGNVLTSQRVTDIVLRAFQACAASQGDCNNLTFGIDKDISEELQVSQYGYYETIAGGAGAGPGWDGASGVHTHMTNTRITDLEILEKRYPVILHRFSLRPGSGGRGRFKGGDGCIREIEFQIPTIVSILSERRAFAPYGMCGGQPGQTGMNIWVRKGNRYVNFGGKNTVRMASGDRIIVLTPGGGGWGVDSSVDDQAKLGYLHAKDSWKVPIP